MSDRRDREDELEEFMHARLGKVLEELRMAEGVGEREKCQIFYHVCMSALSATIQTILDDIRDPFEFKIATEFLKRHHMKTIDRVCEEALKSQRESRN